MEIFHHPHHAILVTTQDMSSWSLTYCEVIHVFDNLMESWTKILDSFGRECCLSLK